MADYFIGITDKGKKRERNEDTFIAQELLDKQFLVACVIDGVGGYDGGEIAAEIAREAILEQLDSISGDMIKTLRNAIVTANAKIQQEKKASNKNELMACVLTCVITDIKNNKLFYAHVGDTRLYLLRDDSLVKISKDHSVVGFLEESGRLSEEDAMSHPRRNEINKALGFEEMINNSSDYIETGESPFLPGDTILLCSDGLSDMINSAEILSILNNNNTLPAKASALVNAANESGGNDNITAVLVENNKQPKKQEALKPIERKNANGKPPLTIVKTAVEPNTSTTKKAGNRPAILFGLISAGLLIALLISLTQNKILAKKNNNELKAISTIKNEKVVQLISHLTDSSKMYSIPQTDSLLQISETVLINKDSFTLNGNGDTIIAAAGFKGPAFIINNNAKHIVLDSIVFKGFDVGIILQKNNLVLKNVRFANCIVPIQYQLSFADSLVSGHVTDSAFIINSTLNKR